MGSVSKALAGKITEFLTFVNNFSRNKLVLVYVTSLACRVGRVDLPALVGRAHDTDRDAPPPAIISVTSFSRANYQQPRW